MKHLGPRRLAIALALLSLLLFAAVAIGLSVGPSRIGPAALARVLTGEAGASAASDIVLRIRLPRVGLAMLVGASLSVAGVLFQALLRNPLADPFVLGVSGGAALGGILMLSLGGALGFGYAATPDRKGSISMAETLTSVTHEFKQKVREELLSTKLEDVKEFAGLFQKIKETGAVCVLGNEEKIKNTQNVFDHMIKVFE